MGGVEALTLRRFAVGLAVLLGFDAIWLSSMVPVLYKPAFGDMMRPVMERRHMVIGLAAWTLLAIGIAVLAVGSASNEHDAFMMGALLGLTVYGVYNATNLASLRIPESSPMPWMDTAWGTFLSAMAAWVVYRIG